MNRTNTHLTGCCALIALTFALPASAFQKAKAPAGRPVLWQDRDTGSLNLLYGPGGEAHKPGTKFTFVKEDKAGTAPKFEVIDDQGTHWKVKLGEDVKSETAATRLVWAAGYFTDEDYYLPELRVAKMPKLDRGSKYVTDNGVVHDVRLERNIKGQKKNGNWSWFKNPFVGTKEMDGLRVMMSLINNWDLKEINNGIYVEKSGATHYAISDLGATFGETGDVITRSKSNAADYSSTKFVQKATKEHVDFILSSRPFVLSAVDVPNYLTRTHMQDIVKDIPIAHVQWLGKILARLSDEQIRDCFRAAGYSSEEVEEYAATVKDRIRDLNHL